MGGHRPRDARGRPLRGGRPARRRPLRLELLALPRLPPPQDPAYVTVHGTTRKIAVVSPALGGRQPGHVYLPPGYAAHPHRRYPVLYLLHGFPGRPARVPRRRSGWACVEDVLLARHRVKPMILVMPYGSTGTFTDKEWANGVRPHEGWETFVARDLVGAVDRATGRSASGRGRALGGLSEGGYGALNIGIHHPGEFGVVESWSGYERADNIRAIFGGGARCCARNSPLDHAPPGAPALRARAHVLLDLLGQRGSRCAPRTSASRSELAHARYRRTASGSSPAATTGRSGAATPRALLAAARAPRRMRSAAVAVAGDRRRPARLADRRRRSRRRGGSTFCGAWRAPGPALGDGAAARRARRSASAPRRSRSSCGVWVVRGARARADRPARCGRPARRRPCCSRSGSAAGATWRPACRSLVVRQMPGRVTRSTPPPALCARSTSRPRWPGSPAPSSGRRPRRSDGRAPLAPRGARGRGRRARACSTRCCRPHGDSLLALARPGGRPPARARARRAARSARSAPRRARPGAPQAPRLAARASSCSAPSTALHVLHSLRRRRDRHPASSRSCSSRCRARLHGAGDPSRDTARSRCTRPRSWLPLRLRVRSRSGWNRLAADQAVHAVASRPARRPTSLRRAARRTARRTSPARFGDWFPVVGALAARPRRAPLRSWPRWLAPWRYRVRAGGARAQGARGRSCTAWGVDTLAPFALRADKSYFFGEDGGRSSPTASSAASRSSRATRSGPRTRSPALVERFIGFAHAPRLAGRDPRRLRGAPRPLPHPRPARALPRRRGGRRHRRVLARRPRDPQGAPVGAPARARPATACRAAARRRDRPGAARAQLEAIARGLARRPAGARLHDGARRALPARGRGRAVRGRLRPRRRARRASCTSPSRTPAAPSRSRRCRGCATTPNGFNEWLVCETVAWARDRGVERISLNFAPFAALLAPDAELHRAQRVQRRALLALKGHFQLDNLLALQPEVLPGWQRRYVVYERRRDLPRVGIAALAAEAYLPARCRAPRGQPTPGPPTRGASVTSAWRAASRSRSSRRARSTGVTTPSTTRPRPAAALAAPARCARCARSSRSGAGSSGSRSGSRGWAPRTSPRSAGAAVARPGGVGGGIGVLALLVSRGGVALARARADRRRRRGAVARAARRVARQRRSTHGEATAAGSAWGRGSAVSAGVAALAPGCWRAGSFAGAGLGIAAGVLYAAGDVATKAGRGRRRGALFVPALLACHGLAFVALQLGFQRGGRSPRRGSATLFTNALPIVAGMALFHERLPGGGLGHCGVARVRARGRRRGGHRWARRGARGGPELDRGGGRPYD